MTIKEFFKIVPVRPFFSNYAPGVKNFYHKHRGTDGNGKPIDFTPEDRAQIRAGMKRLIADVKAAKF